MSIRAPVSTSSPAVAPAAPFRSLPTAAAASDQFPIAIQKKEKEITSPEDRIMITRFAQRRLDILTSTKMTYLRSLPAEQLIGKYVTVAGHAMIGAQVGATTGVVIAACTGPAFPATVIISVPVCSVVGLGVGAAAGCYKVNKSIKKEFEIWKEAQTEATRAEFTNAFSEHEFLQICFDPIWKTPIEAPVVCGCKTGRHIFDSKNLFEYIKMKGCCPFSPRTPLTMEEVTVDYKSVGIIHGTYRKFLLTAAKEANINPRLMAGINALCNDFANSKKIYFNKELEAIDAQMKEAEDKSPFLERLMEINRLLSPKALD